MLVGQMEGFTANSFLLPIWGARESSKEVKEVLSEALEGRRESRSEEESEEEEVREGGSLERISAS